MVVQIVIPSKLFDYGTIIYGYNIMRALTNDT